MTPMIIDNNVREDIRNLIKFAFEPTSIVRIEQMVINGELKQGQCNPVGDDPRYSIIIPANFKVVYSIEDQGQGIGERQGLGLCRHLSMSVGVIGRVPNPVGLDMIVEEFGFDGALYQCIFWAEDFGVGDQKAFNVLEPIKGWPKDLKLDVENDAIRRLGNPMVMTMKQRRLKQSGQSTTEVIL